MNITTKMFIANLTEGLKVNKNSKGLLKFSSPEAMVQASIRDLKKGKLICLPSTSSKGIRLIKKILPYKVCYKYLLKNVWKCREEKIF